MKRQHAPVERAVCGMLILGLTATLAVGVSKLGQLRDPQDLSKTLTVGAQSIPDLPSVEESDVLAELEAGYRSLDEYASIVERNPFVRLEPRVVEEGSETSGEEGVDEKKILFIYRGMASVGNVVRAVLEEPTSREVFFASSGGQVGKYKVLDITQDTVILSQEDGQEILIKLAE